MSGRKDRVAQDVVCWCMLSESEWETDERRSQVWVYSYFIRGLSDIQGIENLLRVLIKLGTGRL